jgi:hypothetical protein
MSFLLLFVNFTVTFSYDQYSIELYMKAVLYLTYLKLLLDLDLRSILCKFILNTKKYVISNKLLAII